MNFYRGKSHKVNSLGLAFLIGRRIGEILLSKFSLNTPWSLNFSEMSKKAIEHQITIEIPTLAPANIVLAAIDKLKNTLSIDDLQLDSLTPAVAKKKVSDKYSQAVSKKCDRHYQDLLPVRSDRPSLYTHVFRAAYAAISIHWIVRPTSPTTLLERKFSDTIQSAVMVKNSPTIKLARIMPTTRSALVTATATDAWGLSWARLTSFRYSPHSIPIV
jgi:hypothetical protein